MQAWDSPSHPPPPTLYTIYLLSVAHVCQPPLLSEQNKQRHGEEGEYFLGNSGVHSRRWEENRSEYKADNPAPAVRQIAAICDGRGDGGALQPEWQAHHYIGKVFLKKSSKHNLNTKHLEAVEVSCEEEILWNKWRNYFLGDLSKKHKSTQCQG